MPVPQPAKDKDKDKDKEPVLNFSKPILGEGIITNAPPTGLEPEAVDEKGGLDFSRPITGSGIKTNLPSQTWSGVLIGGEEKKEPRFPKRERGQMTKEYRESIGNRVKLPDERR